MRPADAEAREAEEQPAAPSVARLEFLQAQMSYSGPLPVPDMLAAYDEVVPGAARRMIESWERQTQHRHSLERQMVASNITNRSRGQIMAFVIAMTAIVGGIVLVALNKKVAGLATIFVPLSTIAGVFVYSQYRARSIEDAAAEAIDRTSGGDNQS